MCRVCWIPNPKKMSEKQLAELFAFLEKSQGGCGNGYGGFVNGKAVVKKGIELTTEQIAKEIRLIKWDNGVLFHTRIASKGSKMDKNCHPFHYDEVIVCHNGTLRDASQYAIQMLMDGIFSKEMKANCKDSPDGKHLPKKKTGWYSNAEFECAFCGDDLADITDSEIITFLLNKYGLDILKTLMKSAYSHVILIMDKDGVSAYTSGSFEVLEVKKNIFIYASEFPDEMKDKSKKKDLFHAPDFDSGKLFKLEPDITSLEELTSEVIKEPSTTVTQYWYGDDWYDSRCGGFTRSGASGGTGNAYSSYNRRSQVEQHKPEKKEVTLSPEMFASVVVGNTVLTEELEKIMKKET